jgi:hypothetical protein
LALGDHVHQFDAAQQDAGTTKILEAQHGPRASLAEIFKLDVASTIGFQAAFCSCV